MAQENMSEMMHLRGYRKRLRSILGQKKFCGMPRIEWHFDGGGGDEQ
jgi:hypothetical protein